MVFTLIPMCISLTLPNDEVFSGEGETVKRERQGFPLSTLDPSAE